MVESLFLPLETEVSQQRLQGNKETDEKGQAENGKQRGQSTGLVVIGDEEGGYCGNGREEPEQDPGQRGITLLHGPTITVSNQAVES